MFTTTELAVLHLCIYYSESCCGGSDIFEIGDPVKIQDVNENYARLRKLDSPSLIFVIILFSKNILLCLRKNIDNVSVRAFCAKRITQQFLNLRYRLINTSQESHVGFHAHVLLTRPNKTLQILIG